MERTDGYLVCTFCQKYFFTKLGFQIHKNKEHQQEEAQNSNSFETDKKDFVKEFGYENEGNKQLKTRENSKAKFDKTVNDNEVEVKTKTILLKTAVEVLSTDSKKFNNSNFQCDISQKGFKQDSELQHNVEIGHQKNEHFKCQECDKEFTFKSNLKRHKKIVHDKIKPFLCQECQKCFNVKGALNYHLRSVHEKIKPYHCNMCQNSFVGNGDLQRHIRSIHEKIKPFQCQECGKKFSRKSNLKSHTTAIHDKIKPCV